MAFITTACCYHCLVNFASSSLHSASHTYQGALGIHYAYMPRSLEHMGDQDTGHKDSPVNEGDHCKEVH